MCLWELHFTLIFFGWQILAICRFNESNLSGKLKPENSEAGLGNLIINSIVVTVL